MISSGGILLRRQSRPSSYCVVRFFSHKLARVSEEGIVETFHNDDDEALDAAENGVVDKKNRFYIVFALADTKIDLKVLSQQLGLGKGGLRMAPGEALSEILQKDESIITKIKTTHRGTASVVLAGLVATLKLMFVGRKKGLMEACKLKLGDLKGALFDSKFALCGEDNNVKALFRQGQHSSSVIPA
ncbi:hypothetical protein Ahy_B05g075640 isoform A [Arachis hypogaea]|uniref:YbaK/aminoacyl-tRNA synthetase-associated domain-containing protein n=1 Tax=Arachis hypogaea TaxID=3818 RepID=A0A444Z1L9_ARAHY|nr:hypothetical protein Ahy_B05g075640 isoform A [Arachis hypogaea]